MKRLLAMTIPLAVLVGAAQASITFTTPAGATSAGGAVDASATFTMGNGTLSIDLSNLLTAAQVNNVGQNISDLYFTLSNPNITSGSVASSGGTFINVGANGVVSSASVAGTDKMGWSLSYGNGMFHLNGLGATFSPAHTIIGGTEGSFTAYNHANNSIDNNKPHNPFAQGEADWVLNIAGVNADTRVSNVIFSFGTTAGDNVPAPEPASMAALAIGAAGLLRRRRKLA